MTIVISKAKIRNLILLVHNLTKHTPICIISSINPLLENYQLYLRSSLIYIPIDIVNRTFFFDAQKKKCTFFLLGVFVKHQKSGPDKFVVQSHV